MIVGAKHPAASWIDTVGGGGTEYLPERSLEPIG